MANQKPLVLRHLEDVSWHVLEEYLEIIKTRVRREAGIFVGYCWQKRIAINKLPPMRAARVAEARVPQDQQARSRSRLEAGFQAMLHRAFAGEL